MAFEDCGGLVGQDGLCPNCVQPVLDIDPAAIKDARIGGVLTLPFTLRNASTSGRPLFVTGLWSRTGDAPRQKVDLLWERLAPGQTSPAPVRTAVLSESGVHRVEIAFVAETRFRWRTEAFLFAASLNVTVEGDQTGVVNQTINLTADTIEPGATVYAPVRSEQQARANGHTALDLSLVHAERLELEMGLRGVDNAWRLPRTVPLRWVGFGEGNTPGDGPITTSDGILAIGRSRTKQREGPGDVRVLAMQGNAIDETLSTMISRRHCELYLQNDRLMVRPNSDNGLLIDGTPLSRGEAAVLTHGAVVALVSRYPQAAAFRVGISYQHGVAEEVTITRHGSGARN
ncbi:MAG: FHA domain-containing protein [Pseudomonadota bacterium]